MRRIFETGLVLAGLATVTACEDHGGVNAVSGSPGGMADYIAGKGYQPLKIARAKWGPGTVVSFDKKGNENIVMFNDQCLNLAQPPVGTPADLQVSDVALPQITYSSDRTLGADVGLDKGVSPNVDVSGAFKDQRVKNIEVKVGKAQQQVVSDFTMTTRVKSLLANNSACAQALLQKGNYVIDDVMVLGDTSFAFKGTDNTTVNLDAALLKAINLGGDFAQKLEGKSELPIGEPMIVGYKLYRIEAKLGAAGSDIIANRIGPQELTTLKNGQ